MRYKYLIILSIVASVAVLCSAAAVFASILGLINNSGPGFSSSRVGPVPGSLAPMPIPEPGTMVLFGSGIFGLLATSFKKFFKQIKIGMDIVVAGLALVLTAPLWLVIAIAIKLTSKGPVFFKQERVGKTSAILKEGKRIGALIAGRGAPMENHSLCINSGP